jgi:tRNA A-37 threonylcarbamoyl transferase component Bud32
VNPRADSLAADPHSTLDVGAALSLDSESLRDVGVRGVCSESTTTCASERQLLFVIRNAAQLKHSLLSPKVNSSNDHENGHFGTLEPGAEVGDLRLVKVLGAGAFAKVFLAFHQSMQRLVAIKFSTRPSNEPKLLSSLNHPNIVRVYHYDDRCLSDQGIYVLFMEYVPGVDLKHLMQDVAAVPITKRSGAWLAEYLAEKTNADAACRERSTRPKQWTNANWFELVANIGARVAEALAYAHRQNVVHRDIKPANILLRADGSPMLVDFNVGFGQHLLGARPRAIAP